MKLSVDLTAWAELEARHLIGDANPIGARVMEVRAGRCTWLVRGQDGWILEGIEDGSKLKNGRGLCLTPAQEALALAKLVG